MRRWAHPLRKAIAVLRDEINTALKGAMKTRDERRVSTLRMVNAALKNADLEAQGQGKSVLADQELREIDIIRAYLPAQMSEAEAKAAIAEVIKATGAQSVKDMGKVMAALKQSYAGKMDFGKASGLVKGLLAG